MNVILVTGQSGAGKTKTIDALEDRGVFCVDNVPPSLIPSFVELTMKTEDISHLAVVTDARTGDMLSGLMECIEELKRREIHYKLLYLQCDDAVLIRRYKETRRRHPLQKDRRFSIADAIAREKEMLRHAYEMADYRIDTTYLSVQQLKEEVNGLFDDIRDDSMSVRCLSFGFKHGIPAEADLIFDVRCVPNPFYVPELKEKSGLDKEVTDWLDGHEATGELLKRICGYLDFSLPLYRKEGKSERVVCCGCTGGRHRSVAFAQAIYEHVSRLGYACSVSHRDMEK